MDRKRFIDFLLKPPLWLDILVWIFGAASLAGSISLYWSGFGPEAWAIAVHAAALLFFLLSIYAVLTVVGVPERAKKNEKVRKFFSSYNTRAFVYAGFSVFFNILYVTFGIIIAVLERSAWLGALVGYHVFLTVPRMVVLYKMKREPDDTDKLRAYTYCGLALILLALAIVPVIRLTLRDANTYNYRVSAIVYVSAIAAYTFIKLGLSLYNFRKAHRQTDMALVAVKNISISDAFISVFALQAMMLKVIGKMPTERIALMNGILGGGISAAIFGLGLYMLVHGVKLLKRKNDA